MLIYVAAPPSGEARSDPEKWVVRSFLDRLDGTTVACQVHFDTEDEVDGVFEALAAAIKRAMRKSEEPGNAA